MGEIETKKKSPAELLRQLAGKVSGHGREITELREAIAALKEARAAEEKRRAEMGQAVYLIAADRVDNLGQAMLRAENPAVENSIREAMGTFMSICAQSWPEQFEETFKLSATTGDPLDGEASGD